MGEKWKSVTLTASRLTLTLELLIVRVREVSEGGDGVDYTAIA